MIRVLSTQYTLSRKSLEIYMAGCKGNPHCKNCHNQESWSFLQGNEYNEEYFRNIKTKVENFNNLIDNIELFGGEPLDQDYNDLEQLLKDIKTLNKPIWLFTRFNLKEVPNFVKEYCDYIKCGRYIQELKTTDNIQYNIRLATDNQTIYKKGLDY
jgi:anaerobic ribonucleoside-triphosphate reductase activating protein